MKTIPNRRRLIMQKFILMLMAIVSIAPLTTLAVSESSAINPSAHVALLAENTAANNAAGNVVWERTSYNDHSVPLIGVGMLLLVCAGYIIVRSLEDEMDEAERYAILEDIIEGKDE